MQTKCEYGQPNEPKWQRSAIAAILWQQRERRNAQQSCDIEISSIGEYQSTIHFELKSILAYCGNDLLLL